MILLFYFIPCHTIVASYYGFMLDVRVSVHLSVSCMSTRMGIYWVDMNWVLAIYSVSVQSKYPINLRCLLGI